jgi:O-antigen ligase
MDRYGAEDVLIFIIMFMAISLGLFHMIATVNDIFTVGLVNPERSLETLGDTQRATTQRTTELSLCIACFCMLFIPRGELKTPILKSAYIVLAIIASLCVLHYVSRTGVALVAVTLIVGLVYRWGVSWKTLLLFIIVIALYASLQNTELFQVFASRETDVSNLKNVGLRTERWTWGIEYLMNNPWGNLSIREYQLEYYAHNFWIDYGIAYGLIATFFMVLFSLRSFFSSLKKARRRSGSNNTTLIILTFSVVFVLSLFTEPIIYGAPSYLMMYLMFCGLVEEVNANK